MSGPGAATGKTRPNWHVTTSSCSRRCSSLKNTGIGAFDAVLAAAAHAAGADALVSADAGFSAIANIRHVIPDADGIHHLLDPHQD